MELNSLLGPLQNISVPISPVEGPIFPGNSFLCSKLTLIGIDELLAVEEGTDRDLDAGDAALQLELLDLIGEGSLVGLQDAHHVLAVFLVADEEAPLDVARRARRLDDVALRVLLHIGDGVIEIVEVAIGHDVDALAS